MTKKPKPSEAVHTLLTEYDRADLSGAMDVLGSLLTTGTADPDHMRYVGYLMLSLAERFDAAT